MSNEVIMIRGSRHVVWECRTCGVISTCPEAVWDQQCAEGGFHHCINGHQWGWSKENCEREKLRRERDQLKQRLAQKDDDIAAERQAREKVEADLRRAKKRSAAGTCPCCKRTFANMSQHMKHQHPNFVADTGANVVPLKRQSKRGDRAARMATV